MLRAIRRHIAESRTGRPPTFRELQEAAGLSSTSMVRHHLTMLIRSGDLVGEPADYTLARVAEAARAAAIGSGPDGLDDESVTYPMRARARES